MIIFLDTGPLWLIVHPKGGAEADALRAALQARDARGDILAIAEINDYEARRELIRTKKDKHIANLDALIAQSQYHRIDSAAIQSAAQLWAEARNKGLGGAPPEALDGDVILVAEARKYKDHLVVTKNKKHFEPWCTAIGLDEFAQLRSSEPDAPESK